MGGERWRQVRDLFDQVCDLPREQWRPRLEQLAGDAGLVEEVCGLLQAQTIGLSRVRNRLDTVIAHALAPALDVGDLLGPWRLVEKIARGGMGTVFRAERADGLYRRTVAVKLLHGLPGPGESERLAFERQLLAGLQLPDVARLYDGGSTPDGHPYLVMEYIQGQPLDRYCRDHRLGLRQRLDLFLAICQAVQAAHERLVLHCDLKPSNVLVNEQGRPVLLDFGVARMLNDSRQLQQMGFCTPAYASPELMRGEPVGVASDVYSLGVMLGELVSDSACPRDLRDIDLPVRSPSANAAADLPWKRRLPGDLDAIVAAACELDSRRRYPSVQVLMDDLRRHLAHEPVAARRGDRLYVAGRFLRRRWRSVSLGAAALLVAALFVLNLVQARRQAEQEAAIASQVSDFLIAAFESADPDKRTARGEDPLTARQLLDNAAMRVSMDLDGAPLQQARMLSVLGQAYQNLGVPQPAGKLLQEAVDRLLAPEVNRPLDAAKAMSALSIEKTSAGDGGSGLEIAQRGLELLEQRRPMLQHALLYNAQGLALTNLQRFDQAEESFHAALRVRRLLPDQHEPVQLAPVMLNLGLMYWRWGHLAEAERQFRDAMEMMPGQETSLFHMLETRLAQLLREQGRYAEAQPLLERGMRRAVQLYGPESTFVLLQHEALADLYQDSGDYEAADREHRARLQLGEVVEGSDSIRQAMALYNHGTLQERRGDLQQAEKLYRRSWQLRVRKLGADSPISMRAEAGLAALLARQGRLREAWPLLEHADAGMAASLPEDAPARMEARLLRAEWHVLNGEPALANSLLDAMRPGVKEGTLSMEQMRYLRVRALAQQRLGDAGGAIRAWRAGLEAAERIHGPDNPATGRWRVELAAELLAVGNTGEAAAQLARAAPVVRRKLLPEAPLRLQLQQLIDLTRAMPGPVDPGSGNDAPQPSLRTISTSRSP